MEKMKSERSSERFTIKKRAFQPSCPINWKKCVKSCTSCSVRKQCVCKLFFWCLQYFPLEWALMASILLQSSPTWTYSWQQPWSLPLGSWRYHAAWSSCSLWVSKSGELKVLFLITFLLDWKKICSDISLHSQCCICHCILLLTLGYQALSLHRDQLFVCWKLFHHWHFYSRTPSNINKVFFKDKDFKTLTHMLGILGLTFLKQWQRLEALLLPLLLIWVVKKIQVLLK